jgi:sulfoxide reductase heme-binding subunit YedZ
VQITDPMKSSTMDTNVKANAHIRAAAPARLSASWRPAWFGPGSWGLYAIGMMPAASTFYLAISDQLGADPLKVLERTLGLWALRFLVASLAITPLRRIGGPNLIRYRRTVGLLAFFYAALHVLVYAGLDQGLDLSLILKDVLKRPYITVGLLSFLILIALAVTSNATMIKRMGGAAWQRLHRWVYLAAAAAAVHFIMLVKAWPAEPLVYAALVFSLLLFRFVDHIRKQAFNKTPISKRGHR